ncbi:MtnX-like HAD-IB family phosphatase [Bordetella sp. N]|uniref:MtnX-like HAD-IB family phosphatase n=1 Tax=Bordetella sp. N TaxID=1746199 RepID=UPI00070D7EF8|nr:MtnX-like HAD-IB family phosphatase [Bordetella sp. N]ALM85200.1 phosphatase [Bordetella sp. N]
MNEQCASRWMIQTDFDGTISRQDVMDTLLDRYGMTGWEALEGAWERGEIGSRACMTAQVRLLSMSVAELHESLKQITIDPQFARFVALARELRIPVQVVSDGLDCAIKTVLTREGLGDLPILANSFQPAGPRRWTLGTPWARGNCASANCKCGHLAREQTAGQRVLYIGDGRSDYCVAGKADFVLAKGSLIAHCRENNIPHAEFRGFGDAIEHLHDVVLSSTSTGMVT